MINKAKFDLQDKESRLKWVDWSKGDYIDILITCIFCKHQYLAIDIEPGEFDFCPKCGKGIADWSDETQLAVSQIVLQHLLSLEPSYKNLESIINPEYDHERFQNYVKKYKKLKKEYEDIKVNLNAFIPLVSEDLFYRITEIEVLISQAGEMLEDMLSFINHENQENLLELTSAMIDKIIKSVDELKVEVGF